MTTTKRHLHIEIHTPLLLELKARAIFEGISVRGLIEEAVGKLLADRRQADKDELEDLPVLLNERLRVLNT